MGVRWLSREPADGEPIEPAEPEVKEWTFEAWVQFGIEAGWVEQYCATHDGPPLTEEEREAEEDGGDPCTPSLRVWMEAT